jgi:tRNA nucleotidyltransferase (CCA-adding enzyme)
MITRADLIRAYKHQFRPAAEDFASRSCAELQAQDVMRHGLLTVYPETPLYEAMDLIARHHVTGLPVVNREMTLLGIITEKDLLNCILLPVRPGAPVGPYMSTEVVSFDRTAPLDEVCRCLIEHDFHRVPVLDGTRLAGIISRSAILRKRASFFRAPVA